MQIKSLLTTAFILIITTLSYSQTVASINAITDLSAYNSSAVDYLTYQVVDAETNSALSNVDYSASQQKLQIETEQSIQFISLYKDGQEFMTKMPVFASNLNLSMRNYDTGEYELHLNVEGKALPIIIEISKQ